MKMSKICFISSCRKRELSNDILLCPPSKKVGAFCFAAVGRSVGPYTNSFRSISLKRMHILEWNFACSYIMTISRSSSNAGLIGQFFEFLLNFYSKTYKWILMKFSLKLNNVIRHMLEDFGDIRSSFYMGGGHKCFTNTPCLFSFLVLTFLPLRGQKSLFSPSCTS